MMVAMRSAPHHDPQRRHDLQQRVFDFISPCRHPDIWGRRTPLSLTFSLRDDLHMPWDEFDYLMNDFFLLFQVDAGGYDHLAYFPEPPSQLSLKIVRQWGWFTGLGVAGAAPRPLTVGMLITAGAAGRWPQPD